MEAIDRTVVVRWLRDISGGASTGLSSCVVSKGLDRESAGDTGAEKMHKYVVN